MNIGEVLTKSWKITWKHKILWVFGILAGCGSNGGNYNSSNRNEIDPNNLPPAVQESFNRFTEMFSNPAFIALIVALFCVMWLIILSLNTMGRIGLTKGALMAEAGAEKLSFGEIWRASKPYFWRVLGLTLIVAIPVFVFALIFAVGLVLGISGVYGDASNGDGMLLLFIMVTMVSCCCLFFFMIVLGIISQQAQNAIIIEDMSISKSFGRAWQVITTNLGQYILMLIVLVIIGVAAGILISLPLLITVIPLLFAFIANGGESMATLGIMVLCIIAYLPVSLITNGILMSFTNTAWTLIYLNFTGIQIQPAQTDLPQINPE